MNTNFIEKFRLKLNRKNKIRLFTILICAFLFFSILPLSVYFGQIKDRYVDYKETSNINYEVLLNDNDFFEDDILGKDNAYISNLINTIFAQFNYNLNFGSQVVDCNYSYFIETVVEVKEKNSLNSLYNKSEKILDTVTNQKSTNKLSIEEQVEIDYIKYNNLMKNFVNIYNLEDAESTLSVNLHVSVESNCEDFESGKNEESVISLSIPLTTNTAEIELSNNLVNSFNRIKLCKSASGCVWLLITSILFFAAAAGLLAYTIKFETSTRTPQIKFDKKLKKIKYNYGSYIQTVNSEVDFSKYDILKLNSFSDLLEIRDTIRQPILLVEEERVARFVVYFNSNKMYMFELKLEEFDKSETNANEDDGDNNKDKGLELNKENSKKQDSNKSESKKQDLKEEETKTQDLEDATVEEDLEIDDIDVEEVEGKKFNIPKKTFNEKLLLISDQSKKYYSALKNELLKYKSHSRLSRSCETFKFKGNVLAKIAIGGKSLKLFLALDPNSSSLEKYKLKDFSHKTRYKEVSSMISVKNDSSLKKALNLIQLLMTENGAVAKKKYTEVNFFESLEKIDDK